MAIWSIVHIGPDTVASCIALKSPNAHPFGFQLLVLALTSTLVPHYLRVSSYGSRFLES